MNIKVTKTSECPFLGARARPCGRWDCGLLTSQVGLENSVGCSGLDHPTCELEDQVIVVQRVLGSSPEPGVQQIRDKLGLSPESTLTNILKVIGELQAVRGQFATMERTIRNVIGIWGQPQRSTVDCIRALVRAAKGKRTE